jgi:hypothetical protein
MLTNSVMIGKNSREASGRSRYSSMTISKAQVRAPVGHTTSQIVHQWHSSVSTMATAFFNSTIAPQWQTSIHNPQRLHFSASISGIRVIASPSHFQFTGQITVRM